MTFAQVQNLLDPNGSYNVPRDKWTDVDLDRLRRERLQKLKSDLASATQKFDRLNCKKYLRDFEGHEADVRFHSARLRSIRRLRQAQENLDKPDLALTYLRDAQESQIVCQGSRFVDSDDAELHAGMLEVFIEIESLHAQLSRQIPAHPPPVAAENSEDQEAAAEESTPHEDDNEDSSATPLSSPQPEADPPPPDISQEDEAGPETPQHDDGDAPAIDPSEPPLPGLIHRFQWRDGRSLVLAALNELTIGRSGAATVPISVPRALHLDQEQSQRRISRIHLSIRLEDDDLYINDGHVKADGRRTPSGNGSFLGANRLEREAICSHPQSVLRFISPISEPGIPEWQIECWRVQDVKSPDIPSAIFSSWAPNQPAALHLTRQDQPEDILLVWRGLPLNLIDPELSGWIIHHQEGFFYLDANNQWHPMQESFLEPTKA